MTKLALTLTYFNRFFMKFLTAYNGITNNPPPKTTMLTIALTPQQIESAASNDAG
ncbi:MAG: hypothetical protein U5K00_22695 [Melioribacteraceae bacterium]|nr:hypothetical protein [Melioribacteraceae bacterium]